MAVIKITLDIEINGQPLENFPLTKRLETTNYQSFDYSKAFDALSTTYTTLPDDTISALKALLVMPSQAITLRLNNQSDSGVPINAGGVFLLIDGNITGGAGANNNKLNNNNANSVAAQILGFGAGT